MISILVLGGTRDARVLVSKAFEQGIFDPAQHRVIYSVAGLVRQPKLACEVISGGFSQHGGLAAYLSCERVALVLDLTHPYALRMSSTVEQVCQQVALPYLRFNRAPWRAQPGDNWTLVADWSELCTTLENICQTNSRPSVLVSVGQVPELDFAALVDVLGAPASSASTPNDAQPKVVFRTAAPARIDLAAFKHRIALHWLKALGPFSLEDELALLKQYGIDIILSKNSGGDATRAKLDAARLIGCKVVMLERPASIQTGIEFEDICECLGPLAKQLNELKQNQQEPNQ